MNGECDGAGVSAPVIKSFTVREEREDGTLILLRDGVECEGKFWPMQGRPTTFTLADNTGTITYRVLRHYSDGMLLLGPYEDCYYLRVRVDGGDIVGLCMLALDQLVQDAWTATHVRGEQ